MSVDRYVCCDERRRALLVTKAPPDVSGIDYIEVDAGATTADPTTIHVVLVKPLALPAAKLDAENFVLTGGVRFPAPTIGSVIGMQPGAGTVDRYVLTIPGGQPTDFSTYRLALVSGAGETTAPSFIDTRLSAIEFTFKAACGSGFDCAPVCEDDTEPGTPDPDFDYRVRDYQGFRRQMLDRMTQLVPGFREDDPVDLTTTLIEAAAYRVDQQSYRMDWVGTEAFLSTARSRTSIARHARLVDYSIGEGASARVFTQFEFLAGSVGDGMVLAEGSPLLVRTEGLPAVIPAARYRTVLTQSPIVFETVAPLRLWEWRNHVELHTWADDECRLPRGATAATLVDSSAGNGALVAGDFLLLAEIVSPDTGNVADANPRRRHVVRLIRVTPVVDILDENLPLVTVEWGEEDALPFDLVIQSRVSVALGSSDSVVCAEASANLVLADHGASAPAVEALGLPPADVEALRPRMTPAVPVEDDPWRPVLDRGDLSRVQAVDLQATPMQSARALTVVDPGRCLPVLVLEDDFATWTARRDLLESGRFSRDFVVETAIDGRARVRFGDSVNGLAPSPGASLVPRGRFGVGPGGNLGVAALAHLVLPLAQEGARIKVTNPLPGRGGAAPEAASAIRIAAPQAFRRPDRAVTVDDYADVARRHDEVANAVAIARWTGAWQTIFVYVDRKGGLPVDREFRRGLFAHMERYRLMGFDVTLQGAIAAPLHLELLVCAKPEELRSAVAARVREALRPSGSADARRGFFHPDHFTFGGPLFLSRLVAAVMAVEGVQSVKPVRFQRMDRLPANELVDGVIRPGDLEVLQLQDDPSFPERGRLELAMGGGR